MLDHYHALISRAEKQPALFGLDGSFRSATSFLAGLDLGSTGLLLKGFREWLVVAFDDGNNLAWQALVRHLAAREVGVDFGQVLSDTVVERRAVEVAYRLVREFLTFRDDVAFGEAVIYYRYIEWLRRQDWFAGSREDLMLTPGERPVG